MTDERQFDLSELGRSRFVLGEYTTDEGPYLDDHFIVVAIAPDRFFEFAVGSSQCSDVFSYIKENYNQDVRVGLANSTDYRSKVLYPHELSGSEFLEFRDSTRKTEFIGIPLPFRKRVRNAKVSQLVVDYLTNKEV